MKPKEVFLSHSAKDRAPASKLAEILRQHGVRVWYSPKQIRPSQEFQKEIGKALRRCDWFLVLVSKAAISATWVERELAYALNHSQYNGHILPVKIQKCDHEKLSWTLGSFQMVQLRRGRWNAVYRDVLSVWGIQFNPPKKKKAKKQGQA